MTLCSSSLQKVSRLLISSFSITPFTHHHPTLRCSLNYSTSSTGDHETHTPIQHTYIQHTVTTDASMCDMEMWGEWVTVEGWMQCGRGGVCDGWNVGYRHHHHSAVCCSSLSLSLSSPSASIQQSSLIHSSTHLFFLSLSLTHSLIPSLSLYLFMSAVLLILLKVQVPQWS